MTNYVDVKQCSYCGKVFPADTGQAYLQKHFDKHPRIEDGLPVWVAGMGKELSSGWMQVEFDMGNGKYYRKAFPLDLIDVEDD